MTSRLFWIVSRSDLDVRSGGRSARPRPPPASIVETQDVVCACTFVMIRTSSRFVDDPADPEAGHPVELRDAVDDDDLRRLDVLRREAPRGAADLPVEDELVVDVVA